MTAALGGMQALDFLKNITSQSARNKKLVDFVISQGLSEQDIAAYVSGGQGLTTSQRSDIGRKLKGKENIQRLLDVLKNTATAAGTAYGGYKVAQAGFSLAKSVLGQTGGQTLAQTVLGNLGSNPQAPTQPTNPPSPIIPGAGGQSEPSGPSPGALRNLVTGVATLFGFKSKPLVKAIAEIAESTGQDAKGIYQELSKKYDVSTVEKATQAARSKLKELTGEGKVVGEKELLESKQAQEKVAGAKTLGETKKDFARQLKSSVIRRMDYDPQSKDLEIIFNNDATYKYPGFPEEQFKALQAAGTPAKTKGSNKYGVWWVGKNPSLGATFSRIFKPHLREAGPFKYERIENTPMTEEERQEFDEVQAPIKDKAQKFLSESGKTERTASQGGFAGKTSKVDLPDTRALKIMSLTKHLESLRSDPPEKRNEEMIKIIEDRLKTIKDTQKMMGSKKKKVITEELLNVEKQEGSRLLKKMALLLPKSIAKAVLDRMQNVSEKDVLKFIRDYLLTKSK